MKYEIREVPSQRILEGGVPEEEVKQALEDWSEILDVVAVPEGPTTYMVA